MAGRDVMAEPTNKPINGATICLPAGTSLSLFPSLSLSRSTAFRPLHSSPLDGSLFLTVSPSLSVSLSHTLFLLPLAPQAASSLAAAPFYAILKWNPCERAQHSWGTPAAFIPRQWTKPSSFPRLFLSLFYSLSLSLSLVFLPHFPFSLSLSFGETRFSVRVGIFSDNAGSIVPQGYFPYGFYPHPCSFSLFEGRGEASCTGFAKMKVRAIRCLVGWIHNRSWDCFLLIAQRDESLYNCDMIVFDEVSLCWNWSLLSFHAECFGKAALHVISRIFMHLWNANAHNLKICMKCLKYSFLAGFT